MGTRKGKKRTALTPPPDSRYQPAQPGGSLDNRQPPTPAGPGSNRPESNSESASSYGDTDLSILNSPTNSDNISLFPNISGAMSDNQRDKIYDRTQPPKFRMSWRKKRKKLGSQQ